MPARIIDGKATAKRIREEIEREVDVLVQVVCACSGMHNSAGRAGSGRLRMLRHA